MSLYYFNIILGFVNAYGFSANKRECCNIHNYTRYSVYLHIDYAIYGVYNAYC